MNYLNPCIWEPYQADFIVKKSKSLVSEEKIRFILHQEMDVSEIIPERILILEELNHPRFGRIFFSKVDY